MNSQHIIDTLQQSYPNKAIILLPGDIPTEIICEIEPAQEHPEYSIAISVLSKSIPHKHNILTEVYTILKGTLKLYTADSVHALNEGDSYTIAPGIIHWATSENEAWIKVASTPGWTKEDHIIIGQTKTISPTESFEGILNESLIPSFIYFDLGGVLEIDFSGNNGWNELKEELRVPKGLYSKFDSIFDAYEKKICTTMDIETMKDILNNELGLHIPPTYSLLQGFVKRFEQNPSIWPVIEKAKQQFPIGLFTMMYPGMLHAIEKQRILPSVQWDTVIDSSVIGYTKYDDEMFDIATKEAHTPKEHILLVENSEKHIQKATAFGWQTFLYDTKHPKKASDALSLFLFT